MTFVAKEGCRVKLEEEIFGLTSRQMPSVNSTYLPSKAKMTTPSPVFTLMLFLESIG